MVYRFLDFINEATLDELKRDDIYELNAKGRELFSKYLSSSDKNTIDVIFEPVDTIPDDEKVLQIRSASFLGFNNFDELKNSIGEESSGFLLYSINTDDYTSGYSYAAAKLGTKTSVVRKNYKSGSSKRGNHFRETAFMVIMAIKLWEKEKKKIRIYTIKGEILMDYRNDICEISEDNVPKLIEEYYTFIDIFFFIIFNNRV